jgi:hypothetical protein
LFEPCTLYWATLVTPLHTTLALVQLKAPDCDSDTDALLHVPGPSVTDPKSRSWSLLMTSGFTALAVTDADCVAAAAGMPIPNAQEATSMCIDIAGRRRKLVVPRPKWLDRALQPKWFIFGQPWILR